MMDCVLFEFENVLADTYAARRSALCRALEVDGLAFSEGEYEHLYDRPMGDIIAAVAAARRRPIDQVALDLTTRRADDGFSQCVATGLSLSVGARDVVTALHGRVRLGIVTRALGRDVAAVLALAGLDAAFEGIVAADDTRHGKPSPEPYRTMLTRLARRRPVDDAAVVAIEDGSTGVHAALAAGLRCIAVSNDWPDHAGLAEARLPTLAGQTLASLRDLARRHRQSVA